MGLVVIILAISSIPIKGIAQELVVNNQETSNQNQITAPEAKPSVNEEIKIPIPQESVAAQRVEEPAIGEVIDLRTEDTKTFYDGNGKYRQHIFFEPIHQKKPGKNFYEEISPNLIEATDNELLETENTAIKTKIKKNIKNGKYAKFTSKGHNVVFSILQAEGENKPTLDVTDASAIFKKKENKIVHENIFPDTNLRNILFNQSIKEDIILNKYNGYNRYTFLIETDLTANKTDKGSISFVDDNNKEIFNVPAPTMSDSNFDPKSGDAAISDDVSFTLDKVNNGYKLTLTADAEWLEDSARVYPVYIDPTTSINISTDTYVSSATPDTNYESNKYDNALNESVLRVGNYSSSTGTNYGYLMHPISSIYGKYVQSATLNVFVTHAYHADGTANGLWVSRVDSPISMNSVTWNTQPSSTHIISTNVGIDTWADFNVTTTVKGWANGTIPNYGFMLNTAGHGKEFWKKITSSANSENKPYVSVTYTDMPIPGKVAKPSVQVNENPDSGTGYIDYSWGAVSYATNYTLYIFNGKNYSPINVGNTTSYSTKDKGLWPTIDDVEQGKYQIKLDGLGSEMPSDPRDVYINGYNAGPENGDYRNSSNINAYVVASNLSGSGPNSDVATAIIPNSLNKSTTWNPNASLPKAPIPTVKTYSHNDGTDTGFMDISWNPVATAIGYKVAIFNGKGYEYIDVGNETSYSTANNNMIPTNLELAGNRFALHWDFRGKELPRNVNAIYQKAKALGYTDYTALNNYFVRVIAVYPEGDSPISDAATPIIPAEISEDELNTILLSRGYPFDELQYMEKVAKVMMYNDGGEWIDSNLDKVTYTLSRTEDPSNDQIYEANNFDDLHQQLSEQPVLMDALGDTSWDAKEGIWKGKTYVSYIRQTSAEKVYYIYNGWRWENAPKNQGTDEFGMVWNDPVTKVVNYTQSARSWIASGKMYNRPPVKYDGVKSAYGAKWKLYWSSSHPNIIDYATGYGRIEVRIPKTIQSGTTLYMRGFYYHPWVKVPLSGVALGPLEIDFPTSIGDKWDWEENFKQKQGLF